MEIEENNMYSVLVAEPNLLLREKIAGVIVRQGNIWCVVQVSNTNGLKIGATRLQPDYILADLTLLRDDETRSFLKRATSASRIIALTDSVTDYYAREVARLGLDGLIEKSRVADDISKQIESLRQTEETIEQSP